MKPKPKLITYARGQVHFPRWPKFDRWLERYENRVLVIALALAIVAALAACMIGGGE